jgi:hypothetical protein
LSLSISSCADWARAQLHQDESNTASIFFMISSLLDWVRGRGFTVAFRKSEPNAAAV